MSRGMSISRAMSRDGPGARASARARARVMIRV